MSKPSCHDPSRQRSYARRVPTGLGLGLLDRLDQSDHLALLLDQPERSDGLRSGALLGPCRAGRGEELAAGLTW